MAGIFDGSSFLGIDSELTGDGITDGSTQFLDTYIENRIDGNARYCAQRAGSASKLWAQDGTRKYASDSFTTLAIWALPINRNLDQIDFQIDAAIDCDGSVTTPKIAAKLELRDYQSPSTTTESRKVSATWDGDGTIQEYGLTLPLDAEQVDLTLGLLVFSVRSAAKEENVVSGTSLLESLRIDVDRNGSETLSNTVDATTRLRKVFSSDTLTASPIFHESAPTADSEVYISTPDPYQSSSTAASEIDVEIDELSYIQPTSAHITARHRTDTGSVIVDGWRDKSASSMLPQRLVKGEDVAIHATNLDGIKSRRRLKAVGPTGEGEGDGADWPTGANRDWRYLDHTNATVTAMDEQSIRFDADDAELICHGFLAGFRDFGADESPPGVGGSLQDLESLLDASASRKMQIKLEVDRLTAGDDWSTSTTVASQIRGLSDVPYWPLWHSSFPLISQMYFSRYPVDNGSRESQFRYTFHEGQLWDRDLRLLYPFRIAVDVSTAAKGRPHRAQLTFEQELSINSAQNQSAAALYTVVPSTAYYTRPLL